MKVRQTRAKETRAQLLEAAAASFAQYGYARASVTEICYRAGVSKGAFYHHFSSKQALFLELWDAWRARLDEHFDAARVGATTVPEEICRMAESAGMIFEMSEDYVPILFEFLIQARRDPAVWQTTFEPYRRYHSFFSGLISAGIEEGSLNPVDPNRAAEVLVSLAVGLVLQSSLDPHGADWGQVALDGVQMLMDGLRCPEPSD